MFIAHERWSMSPPHEPSYEKWCRFHLRLAEAGRKASHTSSTVSMYGPPSRSTQYGTAFQISSMVSRIDFGRPGKLNTRAFPLVPPSCLERIAVGTKLSDIARICSPKPGRTRSSTPSVASGVTSLAAGPVPPVVTTTLQPMPSINSINAEAMTSRSSGTHR